MSFRGGGGAKEPLLLLPLPRQQLNCLLCTPHLRSGAGPFLGVCSPWRPPAEEERVTVPKSPFPSQPAVFPL